MILPVVVALLLLAATIPMHYEGLRLISAAVEKVQARPRRRMLLVIFGIVLIHVVEIALFGAGLFGLDRLPQAGAIAGGVGADGRLDALGYFYLSAQTFTTLGFGDYVPLGDMRIVVAIEPIVGLLLIGWSTSFTFLSMQRLWALHPADRRRHSDKQPH